MNKSNLAFQNSANTRKEYFPLDAFKIFFNVIIFQLIASTIVSVICISIFPQLGFETLEDFMGNKYIQYILYLFSALVFAYIFFSYNKKNNVNSIYALSIKKPLNSIFVLIVVLLSICCILFFAGIANLIDYLFTFIGFNPDDSIPIALNNVVELFMALFLLALLPAIFEELLFRGIILKGLLQKYSPLFSILLSSFLFALMHGSLQQTVFQVILGIVLSLVVYIGGNILYGIILHFFNNTIVIFIEYFSVANEAATYKNVYDFLVPIILFVVGCVAVYGLVKFMQRNENRLKIKNNQTLLEENGKLRGFKNIYKSFSYNENLFFVGGVSIGLIIWVIKTISEIVG